MKTDQVLRQRSWTEAELRASKLKYYAPRKQLVMARVVQMPTEVKATIEMLEASKGDLMIYDPGDGTKRRHLDNYEHWPVNRDLFRKSDQPEQSYSERQIYEAALDRLAREVAAVEKIDDTAAVARLEQVLQAA